MLGGIRKRDKTKPKLGLIDQKHQHRQRASHQRAWKKKRRLLQTCDQNWTNVMKNVSSSTVKRRLCEAWLYGRISVKKLLWKKQNNVKRLQKPKVYKNLRTDLKNKVILTDESKFEIFWSNWRVYVRRSVGERTANSIITQTVKHGGISPMMCVGCAFANCQVWNLLES